MALFGNGSREAPFKTFSLVFQVCSDGHYVDGAAKHQVAEARPDTFEYFSRLPSELQLKVWEQLLMPRIVIAACFDEETEPEKRAALARRAKCPPVPVLFQICHMSRQLALRHYELAFGWRMPSFRDTPYHEPRVWFNFEQDTVFLLGVLEPYDPSSYTPSMVRFLCRPDTTRVRHVACAFEALYFEENDSDVISQCTFHVIDAFQGMERLLITSTEDDLKRHPMIGCLPSASDNVVQKIWWGWINGTSVVTNTIMDKQVLMVKEDELASFVAEHS